MFQSLQKKKADKRNDAVKKKISPQNVNSAIQTKSFSSLSGFVSNTTETEYTPRQFQPLHYNTSKPANLMPEGMTIQKKDVGSEQEQSIKTLTPNNTGIPTQMKTEFEEKSGFSFDDVRVHYNSEKPAQLQALAYAQSNQVHIGPRQEKHLRHELGHVVQQKRGIVRPTGKINGININNDVKMEQDANNYMGDSSIASFQKKDFHYNDTHQLFGLQVGDGQEAFKLDSDYAGPLLSDNDLAKAQNILKLANLEYETLFILGHGIPALGKEPPKVDKYNPQEFVEMLLNGGYNPKNHKGYIDFKSCTAGWTRTKDGSFIEQVYCLLKKSDFHGRVCGSEGYALTIEQDNIPDNNRVAIPDKHALSRYQNFGIFKQWKAWENFVSLVIVPILESCEGKGEQDTISAAKNIHEHLIIERDRQLNELDKLEEVEIDEEKKSGITRLRKDICDSTLYWLMKLSEWEFQGITTQESSEALNYWVQSMQGLKSTVIDQIPIYSDIQKYLQPIVNYTNVPVEPVCTVVVG